MEIKKITEALLFASSEPMTAKQIQQLFPEAARPETRLVQLALDSIMMDYSTHAIELKQLASGYRFQVRPEFATHVARLFEEKPQRYSRALLETLAIIAYRQPVTRTDIEEIRGVSVSSHLLQSLLEREWIQVVGQKQVPGLPNLYATTKQFLDYFNLSSLSQLPSLAELKEWDEMMLDNFQPKSLQVNSEQTTSETAAAETEQATSAVRKTAA